MGWKEKAYVLPVSADLFLIFFASTLFSLVTGLQHITVRAFWIKLTISC